MQLPVESFCQGVESNNIANWNVLPESSLNRIVDNSQTLLCVESSFHCLWFNVKIKVSLSIQKHFWCALLALKKYPQNIPFFRVGAETAGRPRSHRRRGRFFTRAERIYPRFFIWFLSHDDQKIREWYVLRWKLEKKPSLTVVIKGKWGFIQVMMMIIREETPRRRQQYNHHQCHALASIIYDPVDCN